MSETFTRDSDGKPFRSYGTPLGETVIIEPIPAPPQTEAEILRDMDLAISAAEYDFANRSRDGIVNPHSLYYRQRY
jgi:hypothetical protein